MVGHGVMRNWFRYAAIICPLTGSVTSLPERPLENKQWSRFLEFVRMFNFRRQKTEDKLVKATKDASKITTEVIHGMMTQVTFLGYILRRKYSYTYFDTFRSSKTGYSTTRRKPCHCVSQMPLQWKIKTLR